MSKVAREKFNVGDEVEWTSKANGASKMKRGKVVFVLSAESEPQFRFVDTARAEGASKDNFGYGPQRNHESYFVLVTHDTGNPKRPRKPDLYWPRVSKLVLVKKTESVAV